MGNTIWWPPSPKWRQPDVAGWEDGGSWTNPRGERETWLLVRSRIKDFVVCLCFVFSLLDIFQFIQLITRFFSFILQKDSNRNNNSCALKFCGHIRESSCWWRKNDHMNSQVTCFFQKEENWTTCWWSGKPLREAPFPSLAMWTWSHCRCPRQVGTPLRRHDSRLCKNKNITKE